MLDQLDRAQAKGRFPISRDPPEGGTGVYTTTAHESFFRFQFLGIPPKGEQEDSSVGRLMNTGFQFLGIPPKGEQRGD